MKRLLLAALLSASPFANAKESAKTCLNIPGRGSDAAKIRHICKKGDIILLEGRHVPYLCDFDSAIVDYRQSNQYLCVYLGVKRQLREGSRY